MSAIAPTGEARLLADIGGTNARFALQLGDGRIVEQRVLACADFPGIEEAIRSYLAAVSCKTCRHAGIAIANPVDGDEVCMTNHHWRFSVRAVRADLGLDTLLVLNDFAALALSLPRLGDGDVRAIGTGVAREGRVIGLVGPGTGLGVAGLIPVGHRWLALPGEGGHTSFSPSDALEAAILAEVRKTYPHVSSERLISGPGLALIHAAHTALRDGRPQQLTPPEIARGAQDRSCADCVTTVRLFSGMLGTFASNVALTLGSLGGLYLGGGVIGGLGEAFDRALFRQRFVAKGRFEHYLSRVPTYEIVATQPALLGVASALDEALDASGEVGSHAVVSRCGELAMEVA